MGLLSLPIRKENRNNHKFKRKYIALPAARVQEGRERKQMRCATSTGPFPQDGIEDRPKKKSIDFFLSQGGRRSEWEKNISSRLSLWGAKKGKLQCRMKGVYSQHIFFLLNIRLKKPRLLLGSEKKKLQEGQDVPHQAHASKKRHHHTGKKLTAAAYKSWGKTGRRKSFKEKKTKQTK